MLIQRARGNADARRDHSAQVFSFAGNRVKGGGRAQINHDAWPAKFFKRSHAIHNTVCAHFLRIFIKHRHTSLDARLHKQRLEMEVALANFAQGGIHGRNHGRNDDATNFSNFNFSNGKQVAKENAVFVHGVRHHGSHAPVGHQPRAP